MTLSIMTEEERAAHPDIDILRFPYMYIVYYKGVQSGSVMYQEIEKTESVHVGMHVYIPEDDFRYVEDAITRNWVYYRLLGQFPFNNAKYWTSKVHD